MEKTRSTTIYAAAVMVFGAYSLLGAGSYASFALMFKGTNDAVVRGIYIFTVFYGICDIYCGSRMLRVEDWARKMVIILASMSVVLGFVFNGTVFANFKEFLTSGKAGVPPDEALIFYRYAVIFSALVTAFEISVVFYFTRPSVKKQFRQTRQI